MKHLIMLLAVLASASLAGAAEPKLPLRSGQYAFQHKFSEQPSMGSIPLIAKIRGYRIELINETQSDVFPKGIIADGMLIWHAESKQWIIGQTKSDRLAKEVGGCSDGPEVIDLERRIYWTC